jgi:hypothetical protein
MGSHICCLFLQIVFMQSHDTELSARYFPITGEGVHPICVATKFLPHELAGHARMSNVEVAVQEKLVKAYNKAERARELLKQVPDDCVRAVRTLVKRAEKLRAATASSFTQLRSETKLWALAPRDDGVPLPHFGILSAEFLRVQRTVQLPAVMAAREIAERAVQAHLQLALRFHAVLSTRFPGHEHSAPTAAVIAAMVAVPAAEDDDADSMGSADEADDALAGSGSEQSDVDADRDVVDPDDDV